MTDDEPLESVAIAAVEAAGSYLRRAFDATNVDDTVDADFDAYDVKAAADVAAEERIVPVIRRAFPEHAIDAEESGHHPGSAEYRWIVDPLDGTNDFAAGLPTFSSAVAVERAGEPAVAAIAVPALGDTYVARRGAGARYNDRRVRAESERSIDEATIAFVVGRAVPADPSLAERAWELRTALENRCKRVIDTWSPCVHWGLLARGRIDGLVAFHPDDDEQVAGELLVSESGVATLHDGPTYIGCADADLLEHLRSLP